MRAGQRKQDLCIAWGAAWLAAEICAACKLQAKQQSGTCGGISTGTNFSTIFSTIFSWYTISFSTFGGGGWSRSARRAKRQDKGGERQRGAQRSIMDATYCMPGLLRLLGLLLDFPNSVLQRTGWLQPVLLLQIKAGRKLLFSHYIR